MCIYVCLTEEETEEATVEIKKRNIGKLGNLNCYKMNRVNITIDALKSVKFPITYYQEYIIFIPPYKYYVLLLLFL